MKTFTILAGLTLAAAAAAPAAASAPESPQAQAGPQRGAIVRGAGGVELGTLEGRRTHEGTAEIVVRGPDGQLRGIPAAEVTMDGDELRVGWSMDRFRTIPTLAIATAVGAPATGAGGNQGPDSSSDSTRPPMDGPGHEAHDDATRRTPVEQQQAPDAQPGG